MPKPSSVNLDRRPAILVLIGMAAFAVYFSWMSINKASVLDTHSSDLGNMWQSMWNIAHGHGFIFTWSVFGSNVSRLSIHADYLLILLSPLTWLWPNPHSLLIIQAVAVALGAWFLYRLANHLLRRPWLAALFAGSYLFYGPLQFAVVWQFHTDTVAVMFILAAFEALVTHRRQWVFWLWFFLALICKEQVGFILGPVTSWLIWRNDRRLSAGWPWFIGWAYALIQFLVVIPAWRQGSSPNIVFDFYYAKLGNSTSQQILNLLRPEELWTRLTRPVLASSSLYLLVPLAGLPLLSPLILAVAVALGPHWLSDDWSNQTVYYHNHVLAIPFLFLAAIFGLRVILQWTTKFRSRPLAKIMAAWIMWWTIIGSIVVSPNPWSFKFIPGFWQRNSNLAALPAMKQRLPFNASVAYSKEAGAFFRGRTVAQELPNGVLTVEYVILVAPPLDSSHWPPSEPQLEKIYNFYRQYLTRSGAFTKVFGDGYNFIYRRNFKAQPEPIPAEFGPPSAIGKFYTS